MLAISPDGESHLNCINEKVQDKHPYHTGDYKGQKSAVSAVPPPPVECVEAYHSHTNNKPGKYHVAAFPVKGHEEQQGQIVP